MNRIRVWGITALTMLSIVCLGSSMLHDVFAESTDGPMGYDWSWGPQIFGNIGVSPPIIMDMIQYSLNGKEYTVTFGRKNGSAGPEGFLTQHITSNSGALNASFGLGDPNGVLLLSELQHPLIPAHTGRLLASYDVTDTASVPNRVIVVVGAAAKQEQLGEKSITRNVVALSGISHQGSLAPGYSAWIEIDLTAQDIANISPTSPFAPANGGYVSANGQTIAIQADEKMVVTAELAVQSTATDAQLHRVAVLRFSPDKTSSDKNGVYKALHDQSFGVGGKVILPGTINYVWDSLLQSDGKILVAVNGSNATLIYRLDTTGALDSTFGQSGVVTLPQVTGAGSLALHPDGILFGGDTNQKGADDQTVELFSMCRLGLDGVLDQNFGTAGCVQTPVQNYTQLMIGDIVAHSGGKIYIVGTAGVPNQNKDIFTMRLTALGSADLQYGMNGVMITSFDADGKANYEGASALILQGDGRLIVGGYVDNYEVQPTPMAFLQRLQPNNFSTTSTLPAAYDVAVTSPTSADSDPGSPPPTPPPASPLPAVNADLYVAMGVDYQGSKAKQPAKPNTPITYIVKVINKGPSDAAKVAVINTLPTGTTAKFDPTNCKSKGGTMTCSLGTLKPGGTATIDIVSTTPAKLGVIVNKATVKSTTPDAVPGNNTRSIKVKVQ